MPPLQSGQPSNPTEPGAVLTLHASVKTDIQRKSEGYNHPK